MAGAGGGSSSGNSATLNLILGVFLKLLGFFVVLYGFTEVDPLKARQAEMSIQERFNINVSLIPSIGGKSPSNTAIVQTRGRSYEGLEKELKAQVDFLSSEYVAHNNTMILRVPANVVLPLDGNREKSPDFAAILSKTLDEQHGDGSHFTLQIVASGADEDALVRGVSVFVEKMVAERYPAKLLAIGYKKSTEVPVIELHIKQVRA